MITNEEYNEAASEEFDLRDIDGETGSYSVFFRPEWSTFFGPQWEADFSKFPRGMYGKRGRLMWAGKLIMQGLGIREIKRRTGIHDVTIKKLYDKLEEILGKKIVCKCGQPVRHRGWCAFRFQKSTARQEFMRKWHQKPTRESGK